MGENRAIDGHSVNAANGYHALCGKPLSLLDVTKITQFCDVDCFDSPLPRAYNFLRARTADWERMRPSTPEGEKLPAEDSGCRSDDSPLEDLWVRAYSSHCIFC